MMRIVTAINFLAGILALAAAALAPPLLDLMVAGAARAGAEKQVLLIADAEKRTFGNRERFVTFSSLPQSTADAANQLGVTIPQGDFVFDAYSDARDALVIRAFTAPAALNRGTLPPMLFRFTIREAGGTGSGEWVRLSDKAHGLLGLPDTLAALF